MLPCWITFFEWGQESQIGFHKHLSRRSRKLFFGKKLRREIRRIVAICCRNVSRLSNDSYGSIRERRMPVKKYIVSTSGTAVWNSHSLKSTPMYGTNQFVEPWSLSNFQLVANLTSPSKASFHEPSSTPRKVSPYPVFGFQPPVSNNARSRRVSQLKVTNRSFGPRTLARPDTVTSKPRFELRSKRWRK